MFFTAPIDNLIGAITPGGAVVVAATGIVSPNPIQSLPDGRMILGEERDFGRAFVFDPSELAVGSQVSLTEVASVEGGLNGVDVDSIGDVISPTGGFASVLTSRGGILRIDGDDFTVGEIEQSFVGYPAKPGYQFPGGVAVHPNGDIILAERFGGAIWRFDPDTGTAVKLATIPGNIVDNVDIGPDGRIFATTLASPKIYEVFLDGSLKLFFS